MRTLFIITFIANLALTVAGLIIGPERVAIHFGWGGHPDSWASNFTHALIMTGFNLLMFVIFYFPGKLVAVTPPSLLSLPNKEYWLKEENRPTMLRKLACHFYTLGIATFALMFMVGLLVLEANLSIPVRFREEIFWWPFGLYMAYVLFWTINILFAFRVPKEKTDFTI